MGKRVASASTLFHPPTTLSLLLGPRGAGEEAEEAVEGEQGGQGWLGGGEQEEKGNSGAAEGGTTKGEGLSHAYPLDSSLQSVHVHYLPRI